MSDMNPSQDPWELRQLIYLIQERHPMYVCEIGVRKGGWIREVSSHCSGHAQFVGVEKSDRWAAEREAVKTLLFARGQQFDVIVGDSHKTETLAQLQALVSGLDLLHIDGDHSYESCRRDYEMYSPLVVEGGLIVIHDVFHVVDVGVRVFWEELRKGLHGPFGRTWEWYHPRPVKPDCEGSMAIGVVEKGNP